MKYDDADLIQHTLEGDQQAFAYGMPAQVNYYTP